jgi:hypothetical protein
MRRALAIISSVAPAFLKAVITFRGKLAPPIRAPQEELGHPGGVEVDSFLPIAPRTARSHGASRAPTGAARQDQVSFRSTPENDLTIVTVVSDALDREIHRIEDKPLDG